MYIDRERIDKYCLGSKQIYLSKDGTATESMVMSYAYPTRYVSRTEQFIHIDESIGWESLLRDIRLCIAELPPGPIVVIIDPLYKVFNRNISEEVYVKPLLDKIDLIMEEAKDTAGVSFIIIHHTRKIKTDDTGNPIDSGSQDATGARTWMRWADTILRIDPDPNDKTMTKVTATFTKHRNAEDVLPVIGLRWNRDTLHPQILWRKMPKYEDTDETEVRGESGLVQLE